MIPIQDLFEGYLAVSDLQRLIGFFGGLLGFRLRVCSRNAGLPSIGSARPGSPCSGVGKGARFLRASRCTSPSVSICRSAYGRPG